MEELKMEIRKPITLEDLLVDIWDEVKPRIDAMRPTWQKFLIEYIRNNYNEESAYTVAINRHVTTEEAKAAGKALLRVKDIDFVLGHLRQKTNHSAIKVLQTLEAGLEAMGVTKEGKSFVDHKARIAAAEALAKTQKVNPPEEIHDSRLDSLLEMMQQSAQRQEIKELTE